MEKVSRDDVAVFVDFENVYVSVREKFDATPNFELIMDRCEDYGRIVIARAYADWYRYPRVTSALFANGVEPMYVPTYYYDRDIGRTGRPIKNSVDIHLCIDAMRTLYSEPNIHKFVLVTGDRDFIPLVNAIRQRGKDVIIIGIGGAASAHLAQSADEFLFYEQIADLKTPRQPVAEEPRRSEERRERAERPERTRPDRAPKIEPVAAAGEVRTNGSEAAEAAAPVETPPADRSPYDTLVEAIKLARQRGFVVNLGSLKVVMRELDSTFHESKVKDTNGKGFSKFKDFVKEAERQGKVQIFTNGTVTEVFLPGEDAFRMSVFADDIASRLAERELETELAAEEAQEPESEQLEAALPAPEAVVSVAALIPEAARVEEPLSAGGEGEDETVRHTFTDREWEVFRTSMSQFTEPVRFAEIFNALRGLRNQEVVELTNNELRELVKQAINRGMLQRTGRGARAYYRLSSQYRLASPEATAEEAAAPSAPEAPPASSEPTAAEEPVSTTPARRRARRYGAAAAGAPAANGAPQTAPGSTEQPAAAGEAEAVQADAGESGGPAMVDMPVEAPTETPKAPRRRARRKPAVSASNDEATAEATPAPTQTEQPEASTRSGSRRRKSVSSEPAAADQPAAAEAPAPTETRENGAKKRRRRSRPSAGESAGQSEA